jgi:hypothetical protein
MLIATTAPNDGALRGGSQFGKRNLTVRVRPVRSGCGWNLKAADANEAHLKRSDVHFQQEEVPRDAVRVSHLI